MNINDLPPLGGRLHLEDGDLSGYARISGVVYKIESDRRGPDGWYPHFTPVDFAGREELQEGIKRLL